jgi:2,4-dienoyl-CoA reductase-like NADH-dependent reductase (Old Yellow Enzyme family)
MASKLFSAVKLGGKKPTQLKHRVVMAPMTRQRMGDDGVPGPTVATFYEQRATDGGLLITEATNISAYARGYYGAPGLFTPEQVRLEGRDFCCSPERWQSVQPVVAHGPR